MALEQSTTDDIARLAKEVSELRVTKDFADEKIKALTIFAAHQDNALWIISWKLQALKTAQDATTWEQLEQEVNFILIRSDNAVIALQESFPTLENLVSEHEDKHDYGTSAAFGEWIDQKHQNGCERVTFGIESTTVADIMEEAKRVVASSASTPKSFDPWLRNVFTFAVQQYGTNAQATNVAKRCGKESACLDHKSVPPTQSRPPTLLDRSL